MISSRAMENLNPLIQEDKNRNKVRVVHDRILSIKVSDKRFNQLHSGRHFEFRKVRIPRKTQDRLRCGDTIYANNPDGKWKALEFITTDKKSDYQDEQIDIIVRVL